MSSASAATVSSAASVTATAAMASAAVVTTATTAATAERTVDFILTDFLLPGIGKGKFSRNCRQNFGGGWFCRVCRQKLCQKIVDQCGKDQRKQGVVYVFHRLRNFSACKERMDLLVGVGSTAIIIAPGSVTVYVVSNGICI